MKRKWWRLRLLFWMWVYGYASLDDVRESWHWTAAPEWEQYREDNFSPKEAILEDASYGADG